MSSAQGPLVIASACAGTSSHHLTRLYPTFEQSPMSDAAKALVPSLDDTDGAASQSGFTTSGVDDEVRRLENKRQSLSRSRSRSRSPTSGLSDGDATSDVAQVCDSWHYSTKR